MKSYVKEWIPPKIDHNVPTEWNWVVAYPEGFRLGAYTDIGAFTYIQAQAGVIVEDNVQIGGSCQLYSVNSINKTRGKIHLKKGCMIGAGTTIFPNVTVEEGVLIKAHSILTEGIYKKRRDNYNNKWCLVKLDNYNRQL